MWRGLFSRIADLVGEVITTLRGLWTSAGLGAKLGYASGGVLVLSGVAHIGVWAVDGGGWEGPLAWRKPILFGLSTGVTCWSIAWLASFFQRNWARVADGLAGVFGVVAVGEVGVITMQTWRGVASHFNTATPFDTWAYYAMELLVIGLTLIIIAFTIALCWPRLVSPQVPPPYRLAARVGMLFLTFACLFGFYMIAYGTERIAEGKDPGIYGEAGVMKFVHGMPIHAIQLLPLAAWLFRRTAWSISGQTWAVATMVAGTVFTLLYAGIQTGLGLSRFDAPSWNLVLGLIGLTLTGLPVVSYFHLGSRGYANQHKAGRPQTATLK